jgi:hypothetical protein
MAIRRFMPRPSNITPAVQWTGTNLEDVKALLTQFGWTPEMIEESVTVTNDVLSVNGVEVQPTQWYGLGMAAVDDATVMGNFQEVTGTGPFGYVLDEGV